ncbi:MAG: SH3 domain-containing protein [Reichenbachiella sp.]|uniref:SH3 domain-containing protein n=1 Tax=Reichenbachiella sp. TaxID=2184521 RepID=UPI002966E6B3|nr:SH3 domain-containing protein [Reichenbachiella sp.]MDW3210919.1 SH3 domain-containing protein [Reichenbachiella sp.]
MKTVSAVNMRTGPGTEYRKIEKLIKGDTVYLMDSTSNENWYQIRYNWNIEYVSSKYIIP